MSVSKWEARLYPSAVSRDPVAIFLQELDKHVQADSRVLDVGAGAGLNRYDLRGRVREIIGVDFDPRVVNNTLLDKGIVTTPGPLPFEDASFDVVFCIYVLEHVLDPNQFVSEIRRLLRPGGVFLAITPNKHHYVALLARLTPTGFHKWLNKKRGREAEDTFPTAYRMNTLARLRQCFAGGFECVTLRAIEVEPHYLKFWAPAFLLGALYERVVNAFSVLAPLRVNLICAFRKTGTARSV